MAKNEINLRHLMVHRLTTILTFFSEFIWENLFYQRWSTKVNGGYLWSRMVSKIPQKNVIWRRGATVKLAPEIFFRYICLTERDQLKLFVVN